jgi:hypothetical protein
MNHKILDEENTSKKFQVAIGNKIAYVEIISLPNHICSVEIPGQEPMFITKIRDKDNESRWISLPQGNDDLAMAIGTFIEEELHSKSHQTYQKITRDSARNST